MTAIRKLIFISIVLWTASISSVYGGYTITTVAGDGRAGYLGDNNPAASARLWYPTGVAVDASGNVYFIDYSNNVIRKVDHASGIISTVAGVKGVYAYFGDGGFATSANINQPNGIAVDISGDLYIADTKNNRIRKVDHASKIISTIAGNGTQGYSGDGEPAISAKIKDPMGVAVDASGNVYIADYNNWRIRKVSPSGIISTIAGKGVSGFTGDGGPASDAEIGAPYSVAVDTSGNVYIGDSTNNIIRKVDHASGIISTIAGNGTGGYSGDGGNATLAQLNQPYGLAVDASGNVYIADTNNHRIRKMNTSGIISTITGDGTASDGGDGGLATFAKLNSPKGVGVDAFGNVYIGDSTNNRIRKLTLVTGIISGKVTKAGGSTPISGALIEALQSGVVKSKATSDTNGNYLITVETATYDVKASASGYFPKTKAGYNVTAGSTKIVDFSLIEQTGVISGTVTKSDGTTPLSGVVVEVLKSSIIKSTATTDTSGNYSITIGLGAYDVKASSTGYISQIKIGYNVIEGSTNTVNFSLIKLSVVSGKVTRSDGATPLSGVVVEVLKSGVVNSNTTTDTSGNYSITIGTGTYDVKASATGYISQIKTGYNVTEGSTNTVNFSLFELSVAKYGVISGTVTRSDGTTPISGVVVEALKAGITESNATTDINGNYSITIGTGTYDVKASATGYLSQTKTGYNVTAGSTNTVNFSLVELSTATYGIISGKVTKIDGTTAIFGAIIEVLESGVVKSNATTDTSGNYSITIGTGTYDVKASATGYLSQTKTGYIVTNGSTVTVNFSLIQVTQGGSHADKALWLGDNLFSPSSGETCKVWFNIQQPGGVTIKICDFMGRQVKSAVDNTSYTAGSYQWNWDGKDDNGEIVPPGLYILYFKYPGGTEKRKIGVK